MSQPAVPLFCHSILLSYNNVIFLMSNNCLTVIEGSSLKNFLRPLKDDYYSPYYRDYDLNTCNGIICYEKQNVRSILHFLYKNSIED